MSQREYALGEINLCLHMAHQANGNGLPPTTVMAWVEHAFRYVKFLTRSDRRAEVQLLRDKQLCYMNYLFGPADTKHFPDRPRLRGSLKRPDPSKHKTTLCWHWEKKNGACPFGSGCGFAHGKEELRVGAAPCQPATE